MLRLAKSTSIIITAAGEGSRWNSEISELKQLAIIDKKPVIQRTIDLLHKYGYSQIYIATKSDILSHAISNAQIIEPKETNSLSDTILSSSEYFSDRTKVLLGDVYYSEQALQTILKFEKGVQFFGLDRSSNPVIEYNRTPEIFALSFTKKDETWIKKLLLENSNFAVIRDQNIRLKRLLLWIRFKKLKENLDMAYGPIPPEYFKNKGYKPQRFWKWSRICFYKPNYDWIYGKLWGLYSKVAEINPYAGTNANWPKTSNSFFTEINDITDDVDNETDFYRLQELIRASSI